MLAPLVVYIFGFTLIPLGTMIRLSFASPNAAWTLANYRYLFSRPEFVGALSNTLILSIVGLFLQLVIGLVTALALRGAFRGRELIRTVLMVPMGVPTLVSGVAMIFIFASTGYLNALLSGIGLIRTPIDWAAGGARTLLMIILADLWKVLPIVILLLLAGLESIPEEIYEAAKVDGAGTWTTFKAITLPLLKPTITMTLVLRAVDAFRIFELPLVLAGRGTPVLATFAYTEYKEYYNPYTSGAASTVLTALILVSIVAYLFFVEGVGRRRDG